MAINNVQSQLPDKAWVAQIEKVIAALRKDNVALKSEVAVLKKKVR